MRSLILTHSGYQDQEVIYPYYRLQEEGKVILLAEKEGKIRGILGTEIEADISLEDFFNPLLTSTFDVLVLPGGVKAMEKLRQIEKAQLIVRWAWENNWVIASICSGAQMLLSTRVPLKGRMLSAYPAMAVDVENTGARCPQQPVAVDGNLISSPHYKYMAKWMATVVSITKER